MGARGHGRAVIALEEVEKRWAEGAGLAPLTLRVAEGQRLALVGPSGCGKSTLLRLVLGLIAPDRGRVVVDGIEVTAETARAVRLRAGYVIQDGGLFPHLTAADNAALMARRLGWDAAKIEARLSELAAMVRLPRSLFARYPLEMSGGQRQRVGIVRALMLDPAVLLLDEPMGALDPVVRGELQDELLAIFTRVKKTVLLVTHDLAEAAHLAPEICVLREGHVVQKGALSALREKPADDFVRAFVHAHRGV